MRVIIADDDENWRKWGELVVSWINNPLTRPATTSALKTIMRQKTIAGDVPGADRAIEFVDYADNGPLYLALPSVAMLAAKLATVTFGPYPLPGFYTIAFGGATKVNLTPAVSLAFALRRIGEYVVNECC